MKKPKKIIAESLNNGTSILHLETGDELLIPYCDCAPNANYRCHCQTYSPTQGKEVAGMGPGYWGRVFSVMVNKGWKIQPEDFGATIAYLIYSGSDLLVKDGNWDSYEERKATKAAELWTNYE